MESPFMTKIRADQTQGMPAAIIWCTILCQPVVLYGCETWSITLRKEYKLKVFKNRVLRDIWA